MDPTSITNATVIIGALTALIAAVREFRDAFVRTIASLLNKPEIDTWWSSISPWKKRLLAVLSSLVLVYIAYSLLPGRPNADVVVNCPKVGCEPTQTVELTWRNVPLDSVLCIFVYSPHDRAYFPQQLYSPGAPSGSFNVSVDVGAPLDTGQDFQVGVAFADKQAQDLLLGYLNDPFRSGFGTTPAGFRIHNSMTVHRR
jgi:hypothetical protein